jgi:hypothetical protein
MIRPNGTGWVASAEATISGVDVLKKDQRLSTNSGEARNQSPGVSVHRRALGERPVAVDVFLVMHRLLAILVLTGFFAFPACVAIAQRGGGGGTSGSSTTAPRITTPSAPAPSTTQSPAPQSATGAPLQRVQPVAPLSPSLQTPSTSSGGSTQGGTASSGVGGSGSPSESAPSAPGGGGNTLQDCMNFWDSGTHMSKAQWRAACLRIKRRIGSAR